MLTFAPGPSPRSAGLQIEGALSYTTRFALADALVTILRDRDLYRDLEVRTSLTSLTSLTSVVCAS